MLLSFSTISKAVLNCNLFVSPLCKTFIKNAVPAVCSALVVSPITYSVDKAIVETSLNPLTTFNNEYMKSISSVKTLISPTSVINFVGLSFMFFITNFIKNKILKIGICFFVLTPFGIKKDINLTIIDKNTKKINKEVYIGFISRDLISLLSATIFPDNINIVTHYLYILILQIPQTYMHILGMKYCNIDLLEKEKGRKKLIHFPKINKNFSNNVFMRSIKNLIQYAIGLKLNFYIFNLLTH